MNVLSNFQPIRVRFLVTSGTFDLIVAAEGKSQQVTITLWCILWRNWVSTININSFFGIYISINLSYSRLKCWSVGNIDLMVVLEQRSEALFTPGFNMHVGWSDHQWTVLGTACQFTPGVTRLHVSRVTTWKQNSLTHTFANTQLKECGHTWPRWPPESWSEPSDLNGFSIHLGCIRPCT